MSIVISPHIEAALDAAGEALAELAEIGKTNSTTLTYFPDHDPNPFLIRIPHPFPGIGRSVIGWGTTPREALADAVRNYEATEIAPEPITTATGAIEAVKGVIEPGLSVDELHERIAALPIQ